MREVRRAGALLVTLALIACSSNQASPSPARSEGPATATPGIGQPTSDAPTASPPAGPSPLATASANPTGSPAAPQPAAGGTLHVAVVSLAQIIDPMGGTTLDPQGEFGALGEVLRCCLARTLMGYRDVTGQGLVLQADLAADMPAVSDDGLEWTFQIRQGIRYAPPYDDRTVVAGDFVRTLHRLGKPCADCPFGTIGAYGYLLYDVVTGFAEYVDGEAAAITGLEAPNDQTLIVHMTRPNGSLGHLLGLTGVSPLPPLPDDPAAPLGAATGHDEGFGPFLAATGPYMLEGSEQISIDGPVDEHVPAPGLAFGEHVYLVRNPSWDAATDPLRTAYPDRIEIVRTEDASAAAAGIDAGTVDVLLDVAPPLEHLLAYRDDPGLSAHFHATPADSQRYLLLNMLIPPMDDIHVRRAVAFAMNREALRQITEEHAGQLAAVARHAVPDSMVGDLLLRYDPFGTPGNAGDLDRAQQEMAESTYDSNGDGMCDDPACTGVLTLSRFPEPFPTLAAELAAQMAGIGIELDIRPSEQFFDDVSNPENRYAFILDITFFKDYPGADSFFIPQFYRPSGPGYWNPMGANMAAEDLAAFGLEGESPDLNPRIEACQPLIGVAQDQCWAQFDQFVMEQLVTLLPYTILTTARTTSDRVTAFAFDRILSLPALDRMAVESR